MDSILSAINEYRIILGAIVLTIIATLLVKKFWDEVSFFWLRVKMNMPVIGKISRLSKQPGRDESGWFHAEKDLCGEFRPYFAEVDKGPKFYHNCKSYLRKVDELGREKLGFFGWMAICIMVFIEAMGFSYVLAGFTIPGASESLQQQGAVGIALLISGLLVALTHKTGHELHNNGLVKKARTWWHQSDTNSAMHPNTSVSLEYDHEDDKDPAWRQILSRINTNAAVKPSYKITVSTAIFVLCVAVGATYVRGQVLQTEQMEIHRADVGAIGEMAESAYSADPYASDIPAELLDSQTKTDEVVDSQIMDANLKGGWATFIVLAVIFIFLQILGVLIGFKTGFGGKESRTAYDFSHKFRNHDEFEAYHERKRNLVSQIAQRNLTKLQSKMSDKLNATATDKAMVKTLEEGNSRTFLTYARKFSQEQNSYAVESSIERRQRAAKLAESENPEHGPAPTKISSEEPEALQSDSASGHGIPEDVILTWMDKLGWDRERTIDLLLKQRAKKEAERKPEVSEEEALRMMEEANQ
ncbi:hypothetical protein [Marinobacter sp. F3R08]|uniref:hypothetical protein n=1 Tax=Marinobacter sp. F3R08 TaxID=2841559 RepID=UPI001C093171|nr:hypothetical protein [Marinobacter sp. F3R08]MBU2952208.1 hypothetical protein [Marinobacter sp. F3R08]